MSPFGQLGLWNYSGLDVYEKPTSRAWEEAEVLITVKASPNPSKQYGDTVCVAGIRVDREPFQWVRLYPIPFRHLEQDYKFAKYDIVRLRIQPNEKDHRAESFRPDMASIQKIESLSTSRSWEQRHPYVQPMADQWTMCSIRRAHESGQPVPSLAMVRPREIKSFSIDRHPGWSEDQKANMRALDDQGDLFDQARTAPSSQARVLEAPRYRGMFRYLCEDQSCRSHEGTLLDWEFTALDRTLRVDSDDLAKRKIYDKYMGQVCAAHHQPLFFVGNIMKHPRSYSILGVYRTA